MAKIHKLGDIAIPEPQIDIHDNDSNDGNSKKTNLVVVGGMTVDEWDEQEKAVTRQRYIAHCKACHLEKLYWDKTLDNYEPQTDSQENALESVRELLEQEGDYKTLVLIGDNGLGKTHLASVAARELNGKIYTMLEITFLIRETYAHETNRTEMTVLEELSTLPFLAIDEIGRTKMSEAALNWLSYIVDKRVARLLPTMLLTNRKFYEQCTTRDEREHSLDNYINKDTMSRLYGARWIVLDGDDWRQTSATKVAEE